MKGIVFDIKHFCVNDGPGIRTTVFLKGCPLNCLWCHNPEGRFIEIEEVTRIHRIGSKEFQYREKTAKEMSAEEIIKEVDKDMILYEESGGGVTLSGGEPLFQYEFLLELLPALKDKGYNTALDTTGYSPREYINKIAGFIDVFLYDIKFFDEKEHIKYTGVSNEVVFKNLSELLNSGKEVIVRFPVIPGVNDNEKNILLLSDFLKNQNGKIKELDLLPFHNISGNKYKMLGLENKFENIKSSDLSKINEIKTRLKRTGLKIKTGG